MKELESVTPVVANGKVVLTFPDTDKCVVVGDVDRMKQKFDPDITQHL